MQQIAAAAGDEAAVFTPDVHVAVDEAAAGDIGARMAQEPFRPARPLVKPHRHIEAGRDVVGLRLKFTNSATGYMLRSNKRIWTA
jgi:hypothetical protein